jgi:cell wall-associated NlpC family hydrolase
LRRARPFIVILGLAAAAIAAPTLAAADPAKEPTISSVEKQLGALAMQNSQLVETYNQARISEAKRGQDARAAAQASVRAEQHYNAQRRQFVQLIQAQYQGSGLGAAGALLDSNSDTNYIDRLDTLNLVSTQTAQVVRQVTGAKDRAVAADKQARQALADAKNQRIAVSKKRVEVQAQISKYQAVLNRLNAQQRARLAKMHDAVTTPGTVQIDDGKTSTQNAGALTISLSGANAKAQAAVKFALAQVGKPYVFGAAGPGSFDCSGLTLAAWHKGGVSLPHSAADQYNYGHHVSTDALEPGDLLFFYQPIGHVTIYIGDGLMVSAPTEGEPVQVVSVESFKSDLTGATRLT